MYSYSLDPSARYGLHACMEARGDEASVNDGVGTRTHHTQQHEQSCVHEITLIINSSTMADNGTPVCVNSVFTHWNHTIITFTAKRAIKGRENGIIVKVYQL